MKRRTLLSGSVGLAAATLLTQAGAQSSSYPNKPIKMIVPYPVGISPDVVARMIAEKLGQALGQPVIIDNRAGAGGMLGAEIAATTPADGYNLFFAVKAVMAIAPNVYPNVKYNPMRDFKGVGQILLVPHILTATPNAPYNNMKELVEYAKRNPSKIDFASLGVGSQPHVAVEAWASKLGIKLTHIPYKTNPSPDVMSGVVSLSLEASTTAIPLIKGGKIKALAISGAERIPAMPEIPTMTEFGANLDANGVIGSSWHGIFTPTGTPDEIVSRLSAEIIKIVKTPEIQGKLKALGLTPTGMPGSVLTADVATDYAFWGGLIKDLGVKVE